VKEHNRLRLERMAARYAKRLDESRAEGEAEFLAAFVELRSRVLCPLME